MTKKGKLALSLSALLFTVNFFGCFGGNASESGNSGDSSSLGVENRENTTLMDYEKHKDRNISVMAWNFPDLEYSQKTGYDTAKNNAMIKDIKDAGFDILNLTGWDMKHPDTEENLRLIEGQIELCNKYDLNTIVFGCNTSLDNENCVFTDKYPDFSDCAGFYGFMPWDEPYEQVMEKLAQYARQFNDIYKGTDAVYLVNLFPSYANGVFANGYEGYLESYGDIVLSQVEGEKWMMVDSYPIETDETLLTNFLYDLMTLRVYSQKYDAYSHMCLQGSATGNKMRSPTKEELYTQVYTALAFGMDAYSWYTYATPLELQIPDGASAVKRDGTKTELYDMLKEVNYTIKSFGYVYKCFAWEGIMLNADKQTSAMNLITKNRELRTYVMEASDTDTLHSVSSESDYVIGVMRDELGNEGFMISNYSDKKTSANIKIDLKFDKMNYLRVYQKGECRDVALNDYSICLELDYGGGAFVIPYYKAD